jgi:hypothetical protein
MIASAFARGSFAAPDKPSDLRGCSVSLADQTIEGIDDVRHCWLD